MITTKLKEQILNGKRYKVVEESICKQESKGVAMSEEMKIDLHFAFYATIQKAKELHIKPKP